MCSSIPIITFVSLMYSCMTSEKAKVVVVERNFIAPQALVWKCWTEADLLIKWFGSDPAGIVLDVSLDVRPGGRFEITFRDSDLSEHTCYGTYLLVEPRRDLKFTWAWKSEPGVESLVHVQLVEEGSSTRLRLEHRELRTESKHDYATGWAGSFGKLSRCIADLS